MKGQIRPESAFGSLLTRLAEESDIIVEIGTFFGNGSTLCLWKGLKRPEQRLITFEVDAAKITIAKAFYPAEKRIEFVHGTIVRPEEFQEFRHPNPDAIGFYAPEKAATASAPYRLDAVPEKIGLLVLDGGDWCAEVEMAKLINRTTIIALDDTNPEKSPKNDRNRKFLMGLETWQIVADDLHDRNGYTVARRR